MYAAFLVGMLLWLVSLTYIFAEQVHLTVETVYLHSNVLLQQAAGWGHSHWGLNILIGGEFGRMCQIVWSKGLVPKSKKILFKIEWLTFVLFTDLLKYKNKQISIQTNNKYVCITNKITNNVFFLKKQLKNLIIQIKAFHAIVSEHSVNLFVLYYFYFIIVLVLYLQVKCH